MPRRRDSVKHRSFSCFFIRGYFFGSYARTYHVIVVFIVFFSSTFGSRFLLLLLLLSYYFWIFYILIFFFLSSGDAASPEPDSPPPMLLLILFVTWTPVLYLNFYGGRKIIRIKIIIKPKNMCVTAEISKLLNF